MIIKREYLLFIALCLVSSIISASCTSSTESTRDISSPSKRLIGHWGVIGDDNLVPQDEFAFQMWFSEVNEDRIGEHTWYSNGALNVSGEDRFFTCNYIVLSENGDTVTLGMFLLGDDPPDLWPDSLKQYFEVSEDGQELQKIGSMGEFHYIDSDTKL
jgi:hypothetical protein